MNGVLVVDKAAGPTSHDVVAMARRALGERRVGHAGTLDPFAEGVLLILVGEARKLAFHLTAADKEYDAVIELGTETDSLDVTGSVIREAAVPSPLTRDDVEQAIARLTGISLQQAPRISALKIGGKRLYAAHREGLSFTPPAREVVLHRCDVTELDARRIRVRLVCGKGFYVRSFARDLAERLGTVGMLLSLRRTRSGSFDVGGALPTNDLERARAGDVQARARVESALISLEAASEGLFRCVLTARGVRDAFHGRALFGDAFSALPEISEHSTVALFSPEGKLVALGRVDGERVRVIRGIRDTEKLAEDDRENTRWNTSATSS